jgi:hypothetical protein
MSRGACSVHQGAPSACPGRRSAKQRDGGRFCALAAKQEEACRCEVCDLEFSSFSACVAHTLGKGHLVRSTTGLRFDCELCKVSLATVRRYELHLNGKRHRNFSKIARARHANRLRPSQAERRRGGWVQRR